MLILLENMFGNVKKRIKYYEHRNFLETATKVKSVMFAYSTKEIEGFFRNSLKNMVRSLLIALNLKGTLLDQA